ncbi:hypothetical protein KCU93_g8428, partial [Aureobasidium melanogenum]
MMYISMAGGTSIAQADFTIRKPQLQADKCDFSTKTNIQPICVWAHWGGPNPWKVRMILEELELPHQVNVLTFNEAKEPRYLELNPNGRLPTIEDPSTGITIWESGAIILYLIDQYDKEEKLSYLDASRKYASVQWLMFQVSGQGPYFGQATWFARFHPKKLPSAIDRYVNKIDRVLGVLDDALSRNNTGWLVGDRCTYADISFVTWAATGEGLLRELQKDAGLVEKYPHYSAWFATLKERPAIARALQEIAAQRKAHGLP